MAVSFRAVLEQVSPTLRPLQVGAHPPPRNIVGTCSKPVRGNRRGRPPPRSLEPQFVHAPAVVDAVVEDGKVFEVRLPARRTAVELDQRAGAVLGQAALDLPDEVPALFLDRK